MTYDLMQWTQENTVLTIGVWLAVGMVTAAIADFDPHWTLDERAMAFVLLTFLGPLTLAYMALGVVLFLAVMGIVWLIMLLCKMVGLQ